VRDVTLKQTGLEKPSVVGKGSAGALLRVPAWNGWTKDGFFMGKPIPDGITSHFHRHEPQEGGSALLGWPLTPVVTVA